MVTRAADYALRATLVLAGLPPGSRLCLNDLAGLCDVPSAYLYKVLQTLARSGLLVPHRGVTGGYELAGRGHQASVLDVVEAVKGLPMLNACVLHGGCHRSPGCPAHPVWREAQDKVREVLAGARLTELARLQARPVPARLSRRSSVASAMHVTPCRGAGLPQPAAPRRRPRGPNVKRMKDR